MNGKVVLIKDRSHCQTWNVYTGNTISKVNNYIRMEITEERVNKLEDRSIEIVQSAEEKNFEKRN